MDVPDDRHRRWHVGHVALVRKNALCSVAQRVNFRLGEMLAPLHALDLLIEVPHLWWTASGSHGLHLTCDPNCELTLTDSISVMVRQPSRGL